MHNSTMSARANSVLFAVGVVFTTVVLIVPRPSVAQACPLAAVSPSTLSKVFVSAKVMHASNPDVVAFTSKLERDDDGTPNAYHRGLDDSRPDPGLDHICNGGSVLEFAHGTLRDRYATGGSIGDLRGVDPTTETSRSLLCKRDYIAIREADFPACGPGALCMIWYGVVSEDRACGYPNSFDGPNDRRCGAPVRQTDARGQPSDYYVTATSLRRPNAPGRSRVQEDYVDGSRVPYVVLPGSATAPGKKPWAAGDLAVVVWKSRAVYAVVGDFGPRGNLGEASRATLISLGRANAKPIPDSYPATTLIFPGSATTLGVRWPLTAASIAEEGRKWIDRAGGAAALAQCPGLGVLANQQ